MKLELKHLAPYLPYGLQIDISNYKCDYVGIKRAVANGYYFIGGELHITYSGGHTGKDIGVFKPILKPLSDLEKDMVVATNLEKVYDVAYNMVLHGVHTFVSHEDPFDLEHLPLGAFTLLVKNHYDVFGLIEQNLAVNLNTL